MDRQPSRPFRSRDWFADPQRSDMTALYLERFMNYGLTPEELRSGRPIIGIAQTGSDLSPCNRIHLDLAKRVRDGKKKPKADAAATEADGTAGPESTAAPDAAKLQQRVAELEAENERLRQQVKALQDLLAEQG